MQRRRRWERAAAAAGALITLNSASQRCATRAADSWRWRRCRRSSAGNDGASTLDRGRRPPSSTTRVRREKRRKRGESRDGRWRGEVGRRERREQEEEEKRKKRRRRRRKEKGKKRKKRRRRRRKETGKEEVEKGTPTSFPRRFFSRSRFRRVAFRARVSAASLFARILARNGLLRADPPCFPFVSTAIHLPIESNPLCEVCRSPELDTNYARWYGVNVCATCRIAGGDTYRMITKSEAKEVRSPATAVFPLAAGARALHTHPVPGARPCLTASGRAPYPLTPDPSCFFVSHTLSRPVPSFFCFVFFLPRAGFSGDGQRAR